MDLPSDDALRWITSTMAQLRARHGDAIGTPELVLPTGKFFPDALTPDAKGIATLLRRVASYAPLSDDLELEVGFIEPEEGEASGGCCSGSSGSCEKKGAAASPARGGIVEIDGGYGVFVHVGDVSNPTLLTTSLARSIGAIVLAEAEEEVDPSEAARVSEICATTLGFGVLLTSGACTYSKGCGGMRMHQGTALGVAELAVALALFLRVSDVKPAAARAHLEATQREAFDEALLWVDSNARLVAQLREMPSLLEDGVFEIEPVQGMLGRFLAKRREAPHEPPAAPVKRVERSEEERARLAETRALVEEALREN